MPSPGSLAVDAAGLYAHPRLVIEAATHTSVIRRAAVDAAGQWAVTASDDKTVRVWSLGDGQPRQIIGLPSGPASRGNGRSVAISPDGALIFVGVSIPQQDQPSQGAILVLKRESETSVAYLTGFGGSPAHLAVSPDGEFLVATLYAGGFRVFARSENWKEFARDPSYDDPSYWAAFANDGRLVTTSKDAVRLYERVAPGELTAARIRKVAGTSPNTIPGLRRMPHTAVFSPDGARLAIAYENATDVDLVDGRTLEPLPDGLDLSGLKGGELAVLAWSLDGATLYAAGTHPPSLGDSAPARRLVIAFDMKGALPRRAFPASGTTVMALLPLPGGDLVVVGGDPWLGRLSPEGAVRWAHGQPQANFRGLAGLLRVSADGSTIQFGYDRFGKSPARFNLERRKIEFPPLGEPPGPAPSTEGFGPDASRPPYWTFRGQDLPLWRDEFCRCGAVASNGTVVIGSDWSLKALDASGKVVWGGYQDSSVWAVTTTGDGRYVVAAFGDGAVRWFRLSDGVELLAFLPIPNSSSWALWTPRGYYATDGGRDWLTWRHNRGAAEPSASVPIASVPGYYRPGLMPLILVEGDIKSALGAVDMLEQDRRLDLRLGAELRGAANLYLLTIGISTYNEAKAEKLKLDYADADARDFLNLAFETQGGLYRDVKPVGALLNAQANAKAIYDSLSELESLVAGRPGDDLVVIFFSGHGQVINDKLWLLPYEVDPRSNAGVMASAISSAVMCDCLLPIAKNARVLLLIDACHSGGFLGGGRVSIGGKPLNSYFVVDNVAVIASSRIPETSIEIRELGHGVFTHALIDAFSDPDADPNNIGLISALPLAAYLSSRVSGRTANRQNVDSFVKSDWTLFASQR